MYTGLWNEEGKRSLGRGNWAEQLQSSVAKPKCSKNFELRFIVSQIMLDLVSTLKIAHTLTQTKKNKKQNENCTLTAAQ